METLMLVLALSIDAFVASMAYGANKIRIPFTSIIIIDIVCIFLLTVSISLGELVKTFLSPYITSIFSFLILFCIGIFYLFESIVKTYFKNKISSKERVKVKVFDIWLIIDVYVDETKADIDNSKNLNSKEALYLAIALSLDSLAVGFGSALGRINILFVILMSLLFNIFAIWSGLVIGRKFVEKSEQNLSWITGILLIALALFKLKQPTF